MNAFFTKDSNNRLHLWIKKSVTGNADDKLAYFKRCAIKALKAAAIREAKNEKKEIQKALLCLDMMKGGAAPGTEVDWPSGHYKKSDSGRWVRVGAGRKASYNAETKGAKIAIKAVMRNVARCGSYEELLRIVVANKSRFSDDNGLPLPFVQQLMDAVSEKHKGFKAQRKAEGAKTTENTERKFSVGGGKYASTGEKLNDIRKTEERWSKNPPKERDRNSIEKEKNANIKEYHRLMKEYNKTHDEGAFELANWRMDNYQLYGDLLAMLDKQQAEKEKPQAKQEPTKAPEPAKPRAVYENREPDAEWQQKKRLRAELKQVLSGYKDDIVNKESGRIVHIAKKGIEKISSDDAIEKTAANGFSIDDHFEAAKQVVSLFENAAFLGEFPDTKNNKRNLHIERYMSETITLGSNKKAQVYITVKHSLTDDGRRIYSIEAMDIKKASAVTAEARAGRGLNAENPNHDASIPQNEEKSSPNAKLFAEADKVIDEYAATLEGSDEWKKALKDKEKYQQEKTQLLDKLAKKITEHSKIDAPEGMSKCSAIFDKYSKIDNPTYEDIEHFTHDRKQLLAERTILMAKNENDYDTGKIDWSTEFDNKNAIMDKYGAYDTESDDGRVTWEFDSIVDTDGGSPFPEKMQELLEKEHSDGHWDFDEEATRLYNECYLTDADYDGGALKEIKDISLKLAMADSDAEFGGERALFERYKNNSTHLTDEVIKDCGFKGLVVDETGRMNALQTVVLAAQNGNLQVKNLKKEPFTTYDGTEYIKNRPTVFVGEKKIKLYRGDEPLVNFVKHLLAKAKKQAVKKSWADDNYVVDDFHLFGKGDSDVLHFQEVPRRRTSHVRSVI